MNNPRKVWRAGNLIANIAKAKEANIATSTIVNELNVKMDAQNINVQFSEADITAMLKTHESIQQSNPLPTTKVNALIDFSDGILD